MGHDSSGLLGGQEAGLGTILHYCSGYEISDGNWITPELSMQQLEWSEQRVQGGSKFSGIMQRPPVSTDPGNPFPNVYIPSLDRVDVHPIEVKRT